MKKTGIVVTILLLLGTVLVPWTGVAAATDGIHQLTKENNGLLWDGTDANITKETTTDYNFTYGDESSVTYTLPWPFSFYGQTYDRITVDTNGNIWFTATDSAYSFNLSDTKVNSNAASRGPVIAAWNNDLSSSYYGGVFIQHKTNPDERVVIEWQTETFTDEDYSLPNNFEVVLFRNGTIRFDYNYFTTTNGWDYYSGISKGNGTYYDITTPFGNVSALGGSSYTFTDTTAPKSTVRINNGVTYTTSSAATLSLWCLENITCTQVQFSNDNLTWSGSTPFAVTKAWTLSGGDGTKTVYAKVQDSTGTWYTAAPDTIQLDSTAPTTTASPAGGVYTSISIALTCNDGAGSGCDKIYYTTDGSSPTTASAIYSAPVALTVSSSLKYFATDKAGNAEAVKTQSYTIDSLPPTGTISINNSAAATNGINAILALTCSDNAGCSQMQFRNNNNSWSAAETFSPIRIWTMASGDGVKTVFARFKDTAGNWSDTVGAAIQLDSMPPVTTATPGSGPHMVSFTVALSCSDANGTGCGRTYYTVDGSAPTTSSAVYSMPITIAGTTNLKFFSTDIAGNAEATKTQLYNFDPAVTAPSGLTVTSSGTIGLVLNWTDNTSDEQNFQVERKTGAGGTYAIIASVTANTTTFNDLGTQTGTTYYYRVRANTGASYTAYSNEASGMQNPASAPSGLTVTAAGTIGLVLNWTDNSSDEQYFQVERKTGAGGTYAYIASVVANT
ncbi:MAG: chitobiase/beta-hexosaminidase C-terminal domain-containing protein, partial [Desulfuromonadales bacterium]|nr:chitobiase/beta-hexosaminidase C-terminal domain-containing protein [Desulfuromonadales bacterium]